MIDDMTDPSTMFSSFIDVARSPRDPQTGSVLVNLSAGKSVGGGLH